MFLVVLLCVALSTASESNELARGWGDEIEWRTFKDGLEESQTKNKPMMVLFHKSWCGACKALKPRFADSQEIRELSEQFVMVNVQDDEEPKDSKYSPDGGYIPRILFLKADGTIDLNINNEENNARYKYFYPEPSQIVTAMKTAAVSLATTKEEL